MSYHNRINVLVESLNLLEKRIQGLTENNNQDKVLLSEAIQQRVVLESEIKRLQRLQWEEDHERLNLDDDR